MKPGNRPRRAGLNAFGFGGSNAHLILEEWCADQWSDYAAPGIPAGEDDLAITGMAVRAGAAQSTGEFVARLFDKAGRPTQLSSGGNGFPAADLQIDLKQLKTPPNDLQNTLGQHLLVLLTALEATDGVVLEPQKTGVYIGMGCDSEMSRHVIRWRLGYLVRDLIGEAPDPDWLEAASNALAPKCQAAHILGGMPNMPANRINRLLDIQGPGFTLAAEENSGLAALRTARLALQAGEIDTAIVGAVDLSCETIHQHAAAAILPANRQVSGDAAVVLVLRRRQDAQRDGNEIIAVISPQVTETADALKLQLNETEPGLAPHFGHAHACSGLLMVAAAAAAVKHAVYLQKNKYAIPWLYQGTTKRVAQVAVSDLTGQRQQLELHSIETGASGFAPNELQLFCYAATDRASLIHCLQTGRGGEQGEQRLALVCNPAQYEQKIQTAIATLQTGGDPTASGCFYADRAVEGEVAFVFNGIAASYSGVSRDLTLAVPQLFAGLELLGDASTDFMHLLEPGYNALTMSPLEQIVASILYGQLHTGWTRSIAAIKPQAMIGISAGELNCLFAAGVWQDHGGMFRRLGQQDIFGEALTNRFEVVDAAWRAAGVLQESDPVSYSTWRVFHPVDEILERIGEFEPLVRVSIIHNDQDCIIVGQQAVCKAFLNGLGAKTMHLGEGISIHTPDIAAYAKTWYDLYSWPTQQVDDIRLYSNAHCGSYTPDRDAVADALTQQAINRVDFRPTIKQAYADGVRIFIEHGARNLCSNWISDILDDKPHISLAMGVPGKNSYQQALELVAQLWSVQVPVDMAAVRAAMPRYHYQQTTGEENNQAAIFRMPTHMPEVQFPPMPESGTPPQGISIPVAPPLPLTTEHWQPTADLIKPNQTIAMQASNLADQHLQTQEISLSVDSRFADINAMHQAYLQSVAAISVNMAHSLQAFQNVLGNKIVRPETQYIAHKRHATPSALPALRAENTELIPSAGTTLPGPKWGRAELEVLSRDKISKVLGPLFKRQDNYRRQVRMPMPPMLLADRVTGIDAEPGSLGTGTIWTETDINWTAWYLHEGHMPPGIMIESGQASLLLTSYLGADFANRGDRVYRLLGGEVIYHGGLARAGETINYEIHIDGHGQQGEVRLFFFHYDCYINGKHRVSVRNGQAGFFTDGELDNTDGLLWEAGDIDCDPASAHDQPIIAPVKQQLSDEEIGRFCDGDLAGCFGESFAFAASHTRSPAIPAGQLRLLDRVTRIQHDGGPCGRGYLRAELDLKHDHWFYQSHFKNDPCMPANLMADGCYQAMAIYLSSLGYTLDKDGWRFEPIPEQRLTMKCRGQATPKNKKLLYEVFVTSVAQHPQPMLIADVLCTVDGLKAFHGAGASLQLVPGWPMEDRPLPALSEGDRRAAMVDDIHGDSRAMLACAQGRPSTSRISIRRVCAPHACRVHPICLSVESAKCRHKPAPCRPGVKSWRNWISTPMTGSSGKMAHLSCLTAY